MANLYGTANPLPFVNFQFLGADVNCPAGVETNVISATLAATSPGFYYTVLFGAALISLGATAPTALTVSARIGAGSDFNSVGIHAIELVAGANIYMPWTLAGAQSDVIWRPPGSVVNVTVNSTGQAVTVRGSGAYLQAFLFRAPDQ